MLSDTATASIRALHHLEASVPDVVISDSMAGTVYQVPAERLGEFRVTPQTWGEVDDTTVFFQLPSARMVEEVPPFSRTHQGLSVLIRDPARSTSYFLSQCTLSQFIVQNSADAHEDVTTIAFVVPEGTEQFDNLRPLHQALLYDGTA